mgnify:CR=1 FL=1
MLERQIAGEFCRHEYVLPKLTGADKDRFLAIMAAETDDGLYLDALAFLARVLKQIYQKNVIILLDEYDVPLENAFFNGFYEQMVGFIRSLFESALKTNGSLEFAVIIGCLRISRESIFTGLNNLRIISILNAKYAEHFGFTEAETYDLLQAYGLEEKADVVREWYDGYRFGKKEVYNPWSILLYTDDVRSDAEAYPKPYWANTSSNSIVRELVERSDTSVKMELEKLIAGGTVEKPVHEDITYDEIYRTKDFSPLYQALLNRDAGSLERQLGDILMGTVSFYDYKEAYYHGFLAGLLKMMDGYMVKSNRESSLGRNDIQILSVPYEGIAIVIEVKVADTAEQLDSWTGKRRKRLSRYRISSMTKNSG